MGNVRRALIAVGVLGLIATAILIGSIQNDRRIDDFACSTRRLTNADAQCTSTSYAPAIMLGVLSVLVIVVAAKWPRPAVAPSELGADDVS